MSVAKPTPLPIDRNTAVFVLTGAGISAESGLPTYRGAGGLWKGHQFEALASPEGFGKDPDLVWRFYSERRAAAGAAVPNQGHMALVELERRLGDRFLLLTQNVDSLHRRAGSKRISELHGSLFLTRCSSPDCKKVPRVDGNAFEYAPLCDQCDSYLRPGVVWFGESIPAGPLERAISFLALAQKRPTLFLAVGTSGAVWPASDLVTAANELGATSILVNDEAADNVEEFDQFIQGKAGELLPGLLSGAES
jgi:NAD-dependent deacetylase